MRNYIYIKTQIQLYITFKSYKFEIENYSDLELLMPKVYKNSSNL